MTVGVYPGAIDLTFHNIPHGEGAANRVGFCDHTAGGFFGTLASPGFWIEAGYSVHFGIALDGRVVQLVNIFDRAYGQGRLGPNPTAAVYYHMGQQNPNEYLISIEHEDASGLNYNGQPTWTGSVWTKKMYDADLAVKKWCLYEAAQHGHNLLRYEIESLTGHHMFDSIGRVNCPGRPWRDTYRYQLYGDLTGAVGEIEEGGEEMKIMELSGAGSYMLTPNGIYYIPTAGVYENLHSILYSNKPEVVTSETWSWFNSDPPNGPGIKRIS